ncbi:hypothetical protein [Streptomyces sp.]|uniref:hypothetical protein n=1 Tax=Streptomyces sp. TaxID=1931 RepID=UPI002D76887D|nr:hypothetical protein [Streptomyces sp.]HET6352658.1 hypothetical protein [Streptomyces sp.]
MLGSSTTGLADYVIDPGFLAALAAAPFRPIAVATTKGESTPNGNTAETITNGIAAALAPGHPVPFSEVPLARSSRPESRGNAQGTS